jgi:hypothetical protein
VLVTLISGTNAAGVFDELFTVSGTKKIAFTTTVSGAETELYTEIERWDWGSEEANLWVKVPTVSSGINTELFLYYDSDHADNTDYIGDTGSTPAKAVWDNNFKLVMHMAQDPNGDVADSIKDSTSNTNHGAPAGTMLTEDLVDGKIGKAIDFDGNDDYIDLGTTIFANTTQPFTTSACVRLDSFSNSYPGVLRLKTNQTENWELIFSDNADYGQIGFGAYTGFAKLKSDNIGIVLGTTYNITVTYNGNGALTESNYDLYLNDINKALSAVTQAYAEDITTSAIGIEGINEFGGIIDEVRVSNIARSAAWIKATYYSNWDGLVTFSEEETYLVFTFTDPIPAHLSTIYGTTEQVCLTTTISGEAADYVYDADFYDEFDVQIGTTVFGIQNGQPAESNEYLSTPSGIDYGWYMTATSSGVEDTSDTYTFHNRFLYEGYVTENNNPISRKVNLYYRNTGELIDTTTSSGSNGYYKLSAVNNDIHFIVVFDDEAGEDYNALILDKLLPVGSE